MLQSTVLHNECLKAGGIGKTPTKLQTHINVFY